MLAPRQFGNRAGFEARRFAADVDRTGRRVLSEQGALRAPQHLDAVQVHEVERRCSGPTVVDLVDIKPHPGFEPIVGLGDRKHAAS